MGFGTIGGSTPDEVTLTKNISGQLEVKTTATGVFPKALLDTSTAYPVGDGSALINLPIQSSGEGHITIMPINYASIVQGTWAMEAAAGSYFISLQNAGSNALNDEVNYKAFLAAGTYTLILYFYKTQNSGIVSLMIDGSSEGTIDMYGASSTDYTRGSITGIVISASGLVNLNMKVTGKTGANYQCYLREIGLFRTA